MKNKKVHIFGTVPKSNRKIVGKKGILDTPNAHVIYDRSLCWLGTGTSMRNGRVKVILLDQTFQLNGKVKSLEMSFKKHKTKTTGGLTC